ncbi:hypothetical protein [Actinomadura sp. HBU206391]|uniref:hypothetical protein n=1 Tax=Actinomadura sp. HBU206391 TaxID=2731692 RepID=UPI0016508A77|nr:hypothetical protein [Actinomadura sp. HBU206391]MBC6458452.1 hypothetical protein [Actinomadura sp. HBU206391]
MSARLDCPKWCTRTHRDAEQWLFLSHLIEVGRVRRGAVSELAVYVIQVDERTSEEWVREAPTVDVTGYDLASGQLAKHDVTNLTLDQARALAWVVEATGAGELAELLRQAVALIEEAGQ